MDSARVDARLGGAITTPGSPSMSATAAFFGRVVNLSGLVRHLGSSTYDWLPVQGELVRARASGSVSSRRSTGAHLRVDP